MKALIVNTNFDSKAPDDFGISEVFFNKISEVYSISFGPLSHAKVLTTDLADRLFSHSL